MFHILFIFRKLNSKECSVFVKNRWTNLIFLVFISLNFYLIFGTDTLGPQKGRDHPDKILLRSWVLGPDFGQIWTPLLLAPKFKFLPGFRPLDFENTYLCQTKQNVKNIL